MTQQAHQDGYGQRVRRTVGTAGTGSTTVETGRRAEQAAAEFLSSKGYEIIERNYRRKHCEIDIVARQPGTVYFIEVKYRATDRLGSGLDYIGGQKLHRMRRAADTWVLDRRWQGAYTLGAIEVSGRHFAIGMFIDSIY